MVRMCFSFSLITGKRENRHGGDEIALTRLFSILHEGNLENGFSFG